jgi:hypothetical protein
VFVEFSDADRCSANERGKRLHQTGNCASFGFAAQAVIPRCGIFDGRLRHVCNCAAPKLHGLTDSFKRPDDRILDLRAKGYQSRNDRSRQKDDDNAPVPASEGRRRVDRPFQARMLCPRNLEMRRIVVSRPTHQWRPFRSLAAAIRSSRIVEVPRFEDTLRTGPAASLVPERDRCRRLNDAWPLAISRTALTHPANMLSR